MYKMVIKTKSQFIKRRFLMNNYNNAFNPLCKPSCPKTALPVDTTVTMAYVPYQFDMNVYCPEVALQNGTLFPVLDKPFFGGRCK